MRIPGGLLVGVVVACTFGVGAGPAPAWAQRKPDSAAGDKDARDARARELWMSGNRLFEEGKYEEALAAFEESYRLSERPGTLVALANTYELLGRLQEALATLHRYEPQARPDEVKVIRERISSLERRVAGKARPQGPDNAGGGPGDDPGQGTQPSGGVSGQVSGQVSDSTATAPQQRERPMAAWIVTGSGGAVVAVGLGLALAASATRDDIVGRCGRFEGQTFCPVDVEPLIDRHRRLAVSADIALGVGLATTAAGVVWLLLGGDDAEAQPAISISPGLQEVRLVVRF
jgi:tetratricopeptide (TPR) repeat protein